MKTEPICNKIKLLAIFDPGLGETYPSFLHHAEMKIFAVPEFLEKHHYGGDNMRKIKPLVFALAVSCVFILAGSASAQDDSEKPVYEAYRGVKIGMPLAEGREKLGRPADEMEGEDYFEFSSGESARVFYDADKNVRAISITYTDASTAPKPAAVLGEDIAPREDGGMYKMSQYPKAGYWVSYVKTGGDEPMVIITIQKMDLVS